jgi:tetratricopeptide (TPR) repeat protein
LQKGQHDLAIADLDRAIQLSPKDAIFFYTSRAAIFIAKGEDDRAIADLDQGIRVNPRDALAYLLRAGSYGHKGDYERAIADCDEVIRLYPQFDLAHSVRGSFHLRRDDPDRAISDFDAAIRLNPNLDPVYTVRATVRSVGIRRVTDQLMSQWVSQHASLFGDMLRANDPYILRGLAHYGKGDRDHAIADLRRALSLNPESQMAKDALVDLGATP